MAEWVITGGRVVVEDGELKVARGKGSYVPTPPFSAYVYDRVKQAEEELAKKNVSHLHHKYYLEEMMLVNEICLKHGKSHEEKDHGDLEFNSQELHEMLAEVTSYTCY